MPELDLTKASNPVPINYTKSCYSFSDPGAPNKNYFFELVLNFNDGYSKTVSKFEKEKCSIIIDVDDRIFYNDIKDFIINVVTIPFDEDTIFTMEGEINHSLSSYIQKNESFYIEFSKNEVGYTNCNCYFIGQNYDSFSISPPM